MTDMTRNCLIGVIVGFPDGQIRAASMPDGTTLPVYNGEASLSEEGTLTRRNVEFCWHSGTFDVTSGKPDGAPGTAALKTFAVKIVEESIYVEH
jgi:nitrite reductase/ring-hydroxylating ferredoxin subunit